MRPLYLSLLLSVCVCQYVSLVLSQPSLLLWRTYVYVSYLRCWLYLEGTAKASQAGRCISICYQVSPARCNTMRCDVLRFFISYSTVSETKRGINIKKEEKDNTHLRNPYGHVPSPSPSTTNPHLIGTGTTAKNS